MASVATVSSKGQVTLPASLRKKLRIREGTRLLFLEDGDQLRVLKEQDMEQMFTVFDRIRKDSRATRKEIDALVEQVRARIWRERHESRA